MCKYKCTLCGRDKFDRDYQPHICNGQFRKKLPKFTKVLTMRNKMHLQSLNIYQSRRFYMDEHPEQEELREDYLTKDKFTFKKLMNMISIISDQHTNTGVDIKTITKNLSFLFEETPDVYFINRWLKRN